MPSFILKFETPVGRYLEYSTIVDAPLCYGCTREEFVEYYRDKYEAEYGQSRMRELPERLDRADKCGTSAMCYGETSVEEAITCNRAGKGETEMTLAQFIEHYCVKHTPYEDLPVGEVPDEEDDE